MNFERTGAKILVETLEKSGVSIIFALSGNQVMPVFDALIDTGIRLIHVRHEAAAVYMAEAWAQLTGAPGVALVAAGPGFANALSPLYSARQSESPVLLISGDSPSNRDQQAPFQAMDQTTIASPLVKQSSRIASTVAMQSMVETSLLRCVAGRPGPVHLSIPQDILQAVDDTDGSDSAGNDRKATVDHRTDVQSLLDTLLTASRPLILTGPQLSHSRAGSLLEQLEANLGIPVICMESPRGTRDPSLGNVQEVFARADLVLCLGRKVDHTIGFGQPPVFAEGCSFLVVDPEQASLELAHLNLGDRVLMAKNDSALQVAKALSEAVTGDDTNDPDWKREVAGLLQVRCQLPAGRQGELIHPAELSASISRVVESLQNPVLVIDGGEFGQWAQSILKASTRVINGPGGAIGGSIPYAIAAKAARPAATVIACLGDGTAGFHLSEFETAVRERIPFVAVIGNDSRWNAEHQLQLKAYGPDRLMGCDLSPTRFDRVVTSLGGYGEHVTRINDVPSALERAIESGLPAVLNVEIEGIAAPVVDSS